MNFPTKYWLDGAVNFSPVNGDALRSLCDRAFWHNAAPREDAGFPCGAVVFCKIDEVWRLFRALRRTRKRIVLVTGEGDKPVNRQLWAHKPPHVDHWFGTNNFVEADSSTPVPLGIGNAGTRVTPSWEAITDVCAIPAQREGLLYANFGTASNPSVRKPLLGWVKSHAWITKESHTSGSGLAGYLRQLRTHHFVLCPPGNGEDTHRMWEALYCGAIPVVRESPAMREFKELPILFVPELTGISENSLRESLGDWQQREYRRDMLDISHWKARIETARGRCREKGPVTMRAWLQGWFREIFAVATPDRR